METETDVKPTEGEVPATTVVAGEEKEEVAEKGFSLDDAIKQTLKKALQTGTLYRGLREACRILDARQGLFCVLAKSCDHGDYVKLVEALCAEHNTHLLRVADGKQLGEWSGAAF